MDEKVSSYRGFLHKSEDNTWLLCDAPNLKSCCLKTHTLATLEGDYSQYPTESPVNLKGVLIEKTLTDVDVQEQNSSFPYWTIGIIICLFFIWKIIKRRLIKI